MTPKRSAPVHPGEMLLADFMQPMGISRVRLAKNIAVPPRRSSGSTFRPTTTLRSPRRRWASGC